MCKLNFSVCSHSFPENTSQLLCSEFPLCLYCPMWLLVVSLPATLRTLWWLVFIPFARSSFSRCLHNTLNFTFEIPYISKSLALFLLGCLYLDLWESFEDLIAWTSPFPGCYSPFFSLDSVLIKRIFSLILVLFKPTVSFKMSEGFIFCVDNMK